MESRIATVEKEQLASLEFYPEEVLSTDLERQERSRNLYLGMVLGNAYKSKVKIVFKSLSGLNLVDTTIWAATDKNIVLKGGMLLPVSCVLQVLI